MPLCGRGPGSQFQFRLPGSGFLAPDDPRLCRREGVAESAGDEWVVAFLGVTVSEALVRVHTATMAAVSNGVAVARPYYLPGAWTPHCTLPIEVADAASVVAEVQRFGLPVVAETRAAHLVELPSGTQRATLL